MIKWDSKYSVNVSMIDEEHKKFIDIINKAADIQKYDNNSRAITEILIEMTTYAQEHFRTEETYMLNFEYYDYKSHIDEHNNFSKKISNYCSKLMNRDLEVIDRVLEDLKQYLVNHIQVTDKKYADCFNENGLK